MNSAQLSGSIATPPVLVDTGNSIYFMLKVRYPSRESHDGVTFAYIPCGVFDATPRQREILLGKTHQKLRVEACGRLEEIVMKDERGRKAVNLGMLVNSNGLLIQRVR
jgi:hypothetical protein